MRVTRIIRMAPPPDCFMTHLVILEVDVEGTSATWGEYGTDEYGQHPG